MTKPKPGSYRILVRGEGDTFAHPVDVVETVRGYVCGDFACRKGRYSYDFTHTPTGLLITSGWVGWVTTKAAALALLHTLATDGPAPHIADALREAARL